MGFSKTFWAFSEHNVKRNIQSYSEKNIISRELLTLERNFASDHKYNVPITSNLIFKLQKSLDNCQQSSTVKKLCREIKKLPNQTHPRVLTYLDTPKQILFHNRESILQKQSIEFSQICKSFGLLRMEHLGNFTGHKSYYFNGYLAGMENAVIQYALKFLKLNKFKIIAVPDVLTKSVIEACGMRTDCSRTQVYKLNTGKCLSGTAEMALAGLLKNLHFEEIHLPLKVAAVSRCYRAETSGLKDEKGIYRVHTFTKVEMFSVCSKQNSEKILEYFKDIEVKMFRNLSLQFRLLDMPSKELGIPAFQKYDIEAWMPGRNIWGEISSCSNCTDYQARRLYIKYHNNTSQYAHTVNGTAAAIPRLLIALLESLQDETGIVVLPATLCKFMKESGLKTKEQIPELNFVKFVSGKNK